MIKINLKYGLTAVGLSLAMSASQFASAQSCSGSHPYACGGACYEDANQAAAGGCTGGSDTGSGGDTGGSSGGSSGSDGSCFSSENPSHVQSGRRTEFTQDWCDTVCVTYVGNGTGCLNAEGKFVSNASICSDPENAREAMFDIEYNLGIDIDDNFIAQSGYQGNPPSINPGMTVEDARTYFRALLGQEKGDELTDALNTVDDGWIDRNEASAAKGADPRQVLTTGFGCGLSTDDIMAYVGLYIGDGAIDKYAGDLDDSVKNAMLEFTRSWQPGVDVQACEYRGGCSGNPQTPPPTPAPTATPTTTPGDAVKVEAESGSILGGASVYDDGAASAGKGVAYISSNGAGFSLSNVPASSALTISYASEQSGQISIRVNGADAGDVAFSGTGAWVGSYASVDFNVNIPANATVDVFYDNGDAAMNVDYVEFNTTGGSQPTPLPTSVPTAEPTPTVAPTAEPTPSPAPTAEPTPTPTDEPTPTPTPTPDPGNGDEYSFIVHKPTGYRFYSCSTADGAAVTADASGDSSACAQWKQVANGSYFHIQNRQSGKFIRPATSDNGAAIQVQPSSWTGNWTQWSYEDRGAGFGHLINRATGKFVYIPAGAAGGNLEQQPSSWRGDYTQWQFQ